MASPADDVTGPAQALARAALQEVRDLHAFFETWLGGTVPESAQEFARLESALADGFTMVSPDGHRRSRAEVIGRLRQAHGSKGAAGAFRIAIPEAEVLALHPPLVVVGYIEEQVGPAAATRRRSTAVLGVSPGDERPRWLAVHETWHETWAGRDEPHPGIAR
jgi:hypothetical protein